MDELLTAMIATDLCEYFGRDRVFQLPVTGGRAADFYTRVPVLFDDSATHNELLDGSRLVTRSQSPACQRERTRNAPPRSPGCRWDPDARTYSWEGPARLAAGDRPPHEPGQELIGPIKRS
ncbi:MAG: hypothetical protein ACXVHB_24760 [Solirubrobacteraceae bacterium]